MPRQLFVFLGVCPVVIATMVLVPTAAVGQTEATSPRTSWGDPDLQGIWSNDVSTPLERPGRFADKEALTRRNWRGLPSSGSSHARIVIAATRDRGPSPTSAARITPFGSRCPATRSSGRR